MNIVNNEVYRTAFAAYLRSGMPIRLTLKQATGPLCLADATRRTGARDASRE